MRVGVAAGCQAGEGAQVGAGGEGGHLLVVVAELYPLADLAALHNTRACSPEASISHPHEPNETHTDTNRTEGCG